MSTDPNYAYYLQKFRNDNGDISYSYVAKLPTTVEDYVKIEKPILSLQVNGRLYPSDQDYIIDLAFPGSNDVPVFVLDPEYLNGYISIKQTSKVARYGIKRLYNKDTKVLSLLIRQKKFCGIFPLRGTRDIRFSVPFSIDISIKDDDCVCQCLCIQPTSCAEAGGFCGNLGHSCGNGDGNCAKCAGGSSSTCYEGQGCTGSGCGTTTACSSVTIYSDCIPSQNTSCAKLPYL